MKLTNPSKSEPSITLTCSELEQVLTEAFRKTIAKELAPLLKKRDPLTRRAYSIAEVAEMLTLSAKAVYNLIHQGKLAYCKLGHRMVCTPAQIQAFLEENTVRAKLPKP